MCHSDFIRTKNVLERYVGTNIGVVVPEGITEIAPLAFCDTPIRMIQLPKSLKTIGKDAFSFCKELISIDIPEGVTIIADGTFNSCDHLRKVHLPSTLIKIEVNAFLYCPELEEINIPDSLQEIQGYAFSFSGKTPSKLPIETINKIKSIMNADETDVNQLESYIDDVFKSFR